MTMAMTLTNTMIITMKIIWIKMIRKRRIIVNDHNGYHDHNDDHDYDNDLDQEHSNTVTMMTMTMNMIMT